MSRLKYNVNQFINVCFKRDIFYILCFSSEKFLGDQKASYNQELKFKLRVGQTGLVGPNDLIIMAGGARVTKISVSLTDQNNPTPSVMVTLTYT